MTDTEMHACWMTSTGVVGQTGDPDALFPYWSFTKTAFAACAAHLAASGRLDLDRPLREHPFTLRQLLNHTAGLPDYGSLPAYHSAVGGGDPPWSRDTLWDRTMAQGMVFEPGNGWSYSNVGYLLVKEEIERVCDADIGRVLCDLFFAPLGLTSVRMWREADPQPPLHWQAAQSYHPGWVYSGCLIGNVVDAATFLHLLMAGKVLNAETVNTLQTPHPVGGAIAGRPWTRCGYGLGMMSGDVGSAGRAIGHSGAGPFCVNAVYHFPDLAEPITVACFTDGPDEGVAENVAVQIALTSGAAIR